MNTTNASANQSRCTERRDDTSIQSGNHGDASLTTDIGAGQDASFDHDQDAHVKPASPNQTTAGNAGWVSQFRVENHCYGVPERERSSE
jgi:hypothetical protein